VLFVVTGTIISVDKVHVITNVTGSAPMVGRVHASTISDSRTVITVTDNLAAQVVRVDFKAGDFTANALMGTVF
jgi:ribosomal protein S1